MTVHPLAPPWGATLSSPQHSLIFYFLVIACLALLAGFVRAYVTRGELGARYRGVTVARLGVMGIASLSYVLVIVMFLIGYDAVAGEWVPNALAENAFSPRYMEWSLTVPLLCAELLAVCTLAGAVARRAQWLAMGCAFAMIFAGFLGAVVLVDSENVGSSLVWFEVGCLFWVFTNIVLIRALLASLRTLTPEAGALLRRAVVILLGGWIVYPAIGLVQLFTFGGEWTTAIQVALCVADIVVKVWFGSLIHRVAQLRTAEDVRAGLDVHPEAIWISSVKQSDAGSPREVYLDAGSTIHHPRARPPESTAHGATAADARAAVEAALVEE